MAMLLRDLQQLLGTLYRLELDHDVRDYLISDVALLRALECPASQREVDEKLLLLEGEHGLEMALYLDQAVLERLAEADPRESIGRHNIADFWTVLEGISHFNYLVWNAGRDQCVTLLELEMQAEVDKYLGTRALLEQQARSGLATCLLDWLFELPVFDPALNVQEAERYRDASHLAGRYCHNLEHRFPAQRLGLAMLEELRSFYRWAQPAKISHIRTTHFN